MTSSNGDRRKSNDPRLNPREQKGQDSCMTVAAPVVVGIGLLKLLRAVQGERADNRLAGRPSRAVSQAPPLKAGQPRSPFAPESPPARLSSTAGGPGSVVFAVSNAARSNQSNN